MSPIWRPTNSAKASELISAKCWKEGIFSNEQTESHDKQNADKTLQKNPENNELSKYVSTTISY